MAERNALRGWLNAAAVYADRRVLAVLFLGFSSGLPLALTTGTLAIWMARAGVDKTTIGLFALVGLPYTLKFLWAPLIDRVPVPLLTRALGRRRGWLIATQLVLMAAIVALGNARPLADPAMVALLALVVAFCSASQDIVVDAYRIDVLTNHQQGAGAAMIQAGYRLGMLASGAGALFLADLTGSWFRVYAVMAALVTVAVIALLASPEPRPAHAADHPAVPPPAPRPPPPLPPPPPPRTPTTSPISTHPTAHPPPVV